MKVQDHRTSDKLLLDWAGATLAIHRDGAITQTPLFVSVLGVHQLLVVNRGRKRAPNLRAADRIIAGLRTLFMRLSRVLRSAIPLKPSTLLHLHSVLRKRKYRMLFRQCAGGGPA